MCLITNIMEACFILKCNHSIELWFLKIYSVAIARVKYFITKSSKKAKYFFTDQMIWKRWDLWGFVMQCDYVAISWILHLLVYNLVLITLLVDNNPHCNVCNVICNKSYQPWYDLWPTLCYVSRDWRVISRL